MTSRTLSIVLGGILVIILGFFALRGLDNILTTRTGPTATTTAIQTATTTPNLSSIQSFADCKAAGYPVSGTSPRQCSLPDGRVYAEEKPVSVTYKNASSDQIRVTNPQPGSVVGQSFKVTGQARGSWYFEASFPVKVLNENGKVVATGSAQAQGDWMTTNFVPFSVDLTVPSYIGQMTLVLSKDNPSGMPENDASISVPITIEY